MEASRPSQLPYYCEKLRLDAYQPPCGQQIALAKAYRAKCPHGFLGRLEHCLECNGRDLITREEATIREDRIVQQEEVPIMAQVQVQAPEQPPAAVKGVIKGQYCKNHPEVLSHVDKASRFMGLCIECLRERAANNSRNRGRKAKPNMTPAVLRDLRRPPAPAPDAPEVMLVECGADYALVPFVDNIEAPEEQPAETREASAPPAEAVCQTAPPPEIDVQGAVTPEHPCKNHPDRPSRIDSLGRYMGLCQACLAARGRAAGLLNHQAGVTAPPVSIPLNQMKYAEVRAWLEEQAAENERTLQHEIMYRLKLAMRGQV